MELEGAPNRAPTVIRTQEEVERAIVDFYGTLYKERPTTSSTDSIREYLGEGYEKLDNIYKRKISASVRETLDTDISEEE